MHYAKQNKNLLFIHTVSSVAILYTHAHARVNKKKETI